MTSIYAGDLVLNSEIHNMIDASRDIQKCLATATRYGKTIPDDVLLRIVKGEITDLWEVRKAIDENAA